MKEKRLNLFHNDSLGIIMSVGIFLLMIILSGCNSEELTYQNDNEITRDSEVYLASRDKAKKGWRT